MKQIDRSILFAFLKTVLYVTMPLIFEVYFNLQTTLQHGTSYPQHGFDFSCRAIIKISCPLYQVQMALLCILEALIHAFVSLFSNVLECPSCIWLLLPPRSIKMSNLLHKRKGSMKYLDSFKADILFQQSERYRLY